jgi:hypothetical protein
MQELNIKIEDRKVSNDLWFSLVSCQSAREFAIFMANAENRGRIAGERFHASLKEKDPVTAEIFRKIAEEEIQHIELAGKFFPEEPTTH